MNSYKKAFIYNLLAQGWSKGSAVILRLVSVPAFIGILGIEDYGRWLVLSAIPSWLSLADVGFGTVSVNQITMDIAAGKHDSARAIYSTTCALLTILIAGGAVVLALTVPIIPWATYLDLSTGRQNELVNAVILLGLSTFLALSTSLFLARFQATGQFHKYTMITSGKSWLDVGLVLSAALYSNRLDVLAGASLAVQLIFLITISFCSRDILPLLRFKADSVSTKILSSLFQQGVSFQALPLSNALLFQGTLLAIQFTLGPSAVAVYGTARTLVRSINQAMTMFTQSAWPEMCRLMGGKDYTSAANLHRVAVGLSFAVALGGSCCLIAFGLPVYNLWTKGTLHLSWEILIVLVLGLPLNSIWNTSSVVHISTNQHSGLAVRYLIGSILALFLTLITTPAIGVLGAALSSLLVDLLLIPYVLKKSLAMTNDTLKAFTTGSFLSIASYFMKGFGSIKLLSACVNETHRK
jgi:O-antigen/teichoic acid export membrane protein